MVSSNKQERNSESENKEQNTDAVFRKLNVIKMTSDDVSKDLEESDFLRYDWQSVPYTPNYDIGDTVPSGSSSDGLYVMGSGICPCWIRDDCTIEEVRLMTDGFGATAQTTTDHHTFQLFSRNNNAAFNNAYPLHHIQFVGSGAYEIPGPFKFDAELVAGDSIYLVIEEVGSPTFIGKGNFQLEVKAKRRRTD